MCVGVRVGTLAGLCCVVWACASRCCLCSTHQTDSSDRTWSGERERRRMHAHSDLGASIRTSLSWSKPGCASVARGTRRVAVRISDLSGDYLLKYSTVRGRWSTATGLQDTDQSSNGRRLYACRCTVVIYEWILDCLPTATLGTRLQSFYLYPPRGIVVGAVHAPWPGARSRRGSG